MTTLLLPKPVRNKEIILRALEGQPIEVIADAYGLEPQTVKGILTSPLVSQELQRLQGEIQKDLVVKIKERSHEALETVTDTMRGELGSELRFKAAKDILDRNPELQPKQQDLAGAIGAGMGEYIVRELARRRAQGGKDERGNSTGGSAQETVVEGAGAGSRSGSIRDDGGDAPVEGEMVEGGGD